MEENLIPPNIIMGALNHCGDGYIKIYHEELLPGEPVIEGQIGQPGPECLGLVRQRYLPIIHNSGIDLSDLRVLELGADFGRLTYSLIKELSPKLYLASEPFDSCCQVLRCNMNDWGYTWPKGIVAAYDANYISTIRPGVANLIVGNAVLHHIVNYKKCLAHMTEILDTPGVMIFVEPIYEAWAYWITVVKSILFATRKGHLGLSDRTKAILSRHVQNISDRISRKNDLQYMSTLEDKHIFSIPDLMEFADRNSLRFHCHKTGADWKIQASRWISLFSIEQSDSIKIGEFIDEVMAVGLGDTLMSEFSMAVSFSRD